MTAGKKRKVLAPEFKAKIGLEALRGERTINEIGLAYGVHPGQVSQFKREIQEQASSLFATERGPKPASTCKVPNDCIDPRRYPLFMARATMRALIADVRAIQKESISC